MPSTRPASCVRAKPIHPSRQEIGPHARNVDCADTSTSSSDDGASDGESVYAPALSRPSTVLQSGVSKSALSPFAPSTDASEALDAIASAAATADASGAESPSAEGDSTSQESDTTPSDSSASAAVDDATGADNSALSSAGKKRKRDDCDASTERAVEEADNDELLPLRLAKVQRSKLSATRAVPPARTAASPNFASPSSWLSPMKDDSKRKRTPRKGRVPQKPKSLESRMGASTMSEEQVVTVRVLVCYCSSCAVWLFVLD